VTHQATRNKRKGAKWEAVLAAWFKANGFPDAERRHLAGANDKGDHAGIRDGNGHEFVVEAKDCATWTPKVWVEEAAREASNAGTPHWIVVIRRRGSSDPAEAFVLTTLKQWAFEVL
jgi:hypothetical protein